jgi:hypothetical protein
MNYSRFSVIVAILIASAVPVFAWGPDGHVIVGRIAELHLTTNAAHAVSELLGPTGHISDNAVANWPDFIRKDRPESAPWHFVDIPFAAEKYDADRDCSNHHGCVVQAITDFQQVLADKQNSVEARVAALKFLVHFVGDIHQPLHCGERNGDQGGNKYFVYWPGDQKPQRLHVIWDVYLPRRNLSDAGLTALSYADKLNTRITPPRRLLWSKGTSADWAWESHQIAVAKVYASLPAEGLPHHLSPDYIKSSQRIVDDQLMKGGLRLALLLNEALK